MVAKKNILFISCKSILFMWTSAIAFLFLFETFAFSFSSPEQVPVKKILVISSRGGGGHTAAVHSLKMILQEGYSIKVVHPYGEDSDDWHRYLDDFYNFMLKKNLIRLMNLLGYLGEHIWYDSGVSHIQKLCDKLIEKERPDLIISIAPCISMPVGVSAQKHKVPHLIITLDYDINNWMIAIYEIKDFDFKITLGADLDVSKGRLLGEGVDEKKIEVIGMPVKLDFFEKKDKDELKKEFKIPEGKRVVLLMMGAVGNRKMIDYAERILSMKDSNLHVMACIGKFEELKDVLMCIPLDVSNSLSVVSFTNRISDLMAISDLIITKPGPGTLSEAMIMHLPILVDNTSTCLYWEKTNIDFICNNNIGYKIDNYESISEVLEMCLNEEKIKDGFFESYSKIPLNQFHLKIKNIVDEMIFKEN